MWQEKQLDRKVRKLRRTLYTIHRDCKLETVVGAEESKAGQQWGDAQRENTERKGISVKPSIPISAEDEN